MKDDGVHENFFTVPELPYKKMEREAILLLKKILDVWYNGSLYDESTVDSIIRILSDQDELVDWVMKYKGE